MIQQKKYRDAFISLWFVNKLYICDLFNYGDLYVRGMTLFLLKLKVIFSVLLYEDHIWFFGGKPYYAFLGAIFFPNTLLCQILLFFPCSDPDFQS